MSTHLLRRGNLAVDSPHAGQLVQQRSAEASTQEFDSTRYLYQLIVRCYECLSLWKLLCEYHMDSTVAKLSKVGQGGRGREEGFNMGFPPF